VVASHYARPLQSVIVAAAPLHSEPSEDSPHIAALEPGDRFDLLDNSLGWAWGYAGKDRKVGYVRSEALGRPN